MARGDDWSERECLLAIWAYSVMDRNRGIRKADLYERISRLTGRTPKSVEYKVQNVSACDPRPRAEKPISEKGNYQKMLRALYKQYGADPAGLDELCHMFEELGEEGLFEVATNEPGGPSARFITEGERVGGRERSRTRSDLLRGEARRLFRSRDGALKCYACDASFDYLIEQGVIEREIIHIHHMSPIGETEVAQPEDIKCALAKVAPLCPTCHALVHAHSPILKPEELRCLLQTHCATMGV